MPSLWSPQTTGLHQCHSELCSPLNSLKCEKDLKAEGNHMKIK